MTEFGVSDRIVDGAVAVLRQWRNDGADGESAHLVCDALLATRTRLEEWKVRADLLWQLLDDIDTLTDRMRPPRTAFYTKVMELVRRRADVLASDGYRTLELPLPAAPPAVRRIAELEAEVRRGRQIIGRDRTGLAEALNAIRKTVEGYVWLRTDELGGNWADYDDTQQNAVTLRQEISACFERIGALACQALYASGRRADSSFHDGPSIPLVSPEEPKPVPMILYCPLCTERHIDEGEFETKVHHTHSCQNENCGHTWRPAIVPTIGVAYLPGFRNESGLALSDEDLGRRLWVFAVNLDGPPDAQHAEALGRRARQLLRPTEKGSADGAR